MSEKRTYKYRAEYLKKAVTLRRRRLKEMAIKYRGGKCAICGYDKYVGSLSLHHRDPKQKDFGLSVKGLTRSWSKIQTELDKCTLLCLNCHMEIHGNIMQLPKETLE